MIMASGVLQQSAPDEEIYYPESDGQPMGETDFHRRQIADLIWTLEQRYADRGKADVRPTSSSKSSPGLQSATISMISRMCTPAC
jgi:hypothetical protein